VADITGRKRGWASDEDVGWGIGFGRKECVKAAVKKRMLCSQSEYVPWRRAWNSSYCQTPGRFL
jgi:hypothetical protein